jgi:Flp pilus assembly protein TadB
MSFFKGLLGVAGAFFGSKKKQAEQRMAQTRLAAQNYQKQIDQLKAEDMAEDARYEARIKELEGQTKNRNLFIGGALAVGALLAYLLTPKKRRRR